MLLLRSVVVSSLVLPEIVAVVVVTVEVAVKAWVQHIYKDFTIIYQYVVIPIQQFKQAILC